MDIKEARLTKQGQPIVGDPEPGKYYRVDTPAGTDVKAAALAFKKKFPKSFFAFRTGKPTSQEPVKEKK